MSIRRCRKEVSMSNFAEQRPIPREIGGITPDDSAAIDDLLNGVHEDRRVSEAKIEVVATGANGGVLQQIEAFLKVRYRFRYNQATNKVEWKPVGQAEKDFTDMRDYDYNTVLREIKYADLSCSVTTLRTILASSFVSPYDPYIEYFAHLPEWDGQTDYIGQLTNTVETSNPEFWQKCFRKWLVALTGSLIDERVVNHTAIIFSGAQGIGKTRWFGRILPEELRRYQFAGTLNLRDKDSQVKLSECPLIVMDELENMGGKNIDALKELITKEHIYLRRAYAYTHENYVRRASFAGSVNHKEFLVDMTGNRRFLCFEVNRINPDHQIPLAMVYAQALHLFHFGFQYWFDQNEIAELNASNEEFRTISVEEEQLMSYFEPCSEEDDPEYLKTTQILQVVASASKVRGLSDQRLGRVLRAKGFLRVKKGDRWMYAVKRKTT